MLRVFVAFLLFSITLPSHAIIRTCLAKLLAKIRTSAPQTTTELKYIPKDVISKLSRLFNQKSDKNIHETYLKRLDHYLEESLDPEGNPRYEVTDVLGAGGQGAVFHAFDKLNQREVAIKVSKPHSRSQENIQLAVRMQQKAAQKNTDSPLLIIFNYDQREDYVFTVSEWLPASSFDKSFERNLPLKTRRGFIFGEVNEGTLLRHINDLSNLAKAIQEIHDEGYIFTDLKPGNFSRLSKGEIKLMDLDSLARIKDGSISLEHGIPLYTPLYASPELNRLTKAKTSNDIRKVASGIGPASDVYAFGLILNDTLELLRDHNFKYDIRLEAGINHLMKNIVPKMLQADPSKRPSMSEVELELVHFQILIKTTNLEELKQKL